MADTKADLQAEVERLQVENEQLRGQLAAAGAAAPAAQPAPLLLSEGERQELEMYGAATQPGTGRLRTREQVLAELADDERYARVQIAEPDPARARTVAK